MRRAVLVFAATVLGLVLLLGFKSQATGALAAPLPGNGGTGSSVSAPATPRANRAPSAGSAAGPSAAPAPTGRRTITGSAVNTPYGPVQVQIAVNGSKVTDVTMLAYPNGTSLDAQINSYALPTLIQQTIATNGTQVDMVSGATYTSQGYLQSLQSALDAAKH